jgi:hypothetical protein
MWTVAVTVTVMTVAVAVAVTVMTVGVQVPVAVASTETVVVLVEWRCRWDRGIVGSWDRGTVEWWDRGQVPRWVVLWMGTVDWGVERRVVGLSGCWVVGWWMVVVMRGGGAKACVWAWAYAIGMSVGHAAHGARSPYAELTAIFAHATVSAAQLLTSSASAPHPASASGFASASASAFCLRACLWWGGAGHPAMCMRIRLAPAGCQLLAACRRVPAACRELPAMGGRDGTEREGTPCRIPRPAQAMLGGPCQAGHAARAMRQGAMGNGQWAMGNGQECSRRVKG